MRTNHWLSRAERKHQQDIIGAVVITACVLVLAGMFVLAALANAGRL